MTALYLMVAVCLLIAALLWAVIRTFRGFAGRGCRRGSAVVGALAQAVKWRHSSKKFRGCSSAG